MPLDVTVVSIKIGTLIHHARNVFLIYCTCFQNRKVKPATKIYVRRKKGKLAKTSTAHNSDNLLLTGQEIQLQKGMHSILILRIVNWRIIMPKATSMVVI